MNVSCSSSTHRGTPQLVKWPFHQPPSRAAFTSIHITEQRLPILLATHDDDDTWQFLWGGAVTKEDIKILCLDCMLLLDPSIAELAALPRGWRAERAALGQPWTRSLSPPEEPEDESTGNA
jgi:hypothetical protein